MFIISADILVKHRNIVEFEKIYTDSWARQNKIFLRNLKFKIILALVAPVPAFLA
jgi:hypothetical protein